MAVWRFSIGNLVSRAPAAPVAVSPALPDPVVGLDLLGTGDPDDAAGFAWRSDGTYACDIDLNLLRPSSADSSAPTGWPDLLMALAGTPGLSANPPNYGTYATRAALRFYRPQLQDFDVMPGEILRVTAGIYFPSSGTATGVRLVLIDLSTGLRWDTASTDWTATGVLAAQTTGDAWLDVDEPVDADITRTMRARYRLILEPVATSYTGTSVCYCSDPAVFAEANFAAIVGHNLPGSATVDVGPITGLAALQPSFFKFEPVTPTITRVWTLSLVVPVLHVRPLIGELWIGKLTDFAWMPAYPFGLEDADEGQMRVIGGRGRIHAASDAPWPNAKLNMQFKADEAGYHQLRDVLVRSSRFGVEPAIVAPCDIVEGPTAFYHGRFGQRVSYSLTNAARHTWTLPFDESPFPRLDR